MRTSLTTKREERARRRVMSILRGVDRFLDRGLLGVATIRLHAAEAVTDLELFAGLLSPSSPVLTAICEAWLERVVRLATLRNEESSAVEAWERAQSKRSKRLTKALLLDPSDPSKNGIYVVTSTNPFVLQRLPVSDIQFIGPARLAKRGNEEGRRERT